MSFSTWKKSTLLFGLLSLNPLYAATITVNSDFDGYDQAGICTLRDAVLSINKQTASGGCLAGDGNNDTIVFDATMLQEPKTITVLTRNGGALRLQKDMIIQGQGKITLDGGSSNQIMLAEKGNNLTLDGLTFRNGALTSYGGAVQVDASNYLLTINNCQFYNNQARLGGGAVQATFVHISNSIFSDNYSGNAGGAVWGLKLTLDNSYFSQNKSGNEGGAINSSSSKIRNTTFVDNSATNNGGAIYSSSLLEISNSTFVGNKANQGGAIEVNRITATFLTMVNNLASSSGASIYILDVGTIHNSLFANNDKARPHCRTSKTTGKHNLLWHKNADAVDESCGDSDYIHAATINNITEIVAETLMDQGGATTTLAIPANSPAIGAAPAANDSTSIMLDADWNWVDASLDQRGVIRTSGVRTVGAVEPVSADNETTVPLSSFLSGLLFLSIGGVALRHKPLKIS